MKIKFPALFYSYKIMNDVLKNSGYLRDIILNYHRNPQVKHNLPLITELTYGVFRWWVRFEYYLQNLSSDKPQRRIKVLIFLGFYQLGFTNIRDSEAVYSTVETALGLFDRKVANFVNAVLNNFLRKKDTLLRRLNELNEKDFLKYNYSFPDLYIEGFYNHRVLPDTQELLAFLNTKAYLYVRIIQDEFITIFERELKAENINFEKCDFPTNCYRVETSSTWLLDNFAEKIIIQDRGAQLASSLLKFPPGSSVLDCCSAPGWKTISMDRNNKGIKITSLDKSSRRLAFLRELIKKGVIGEKNSIDVRTGDIRDLNLKEFFDFIIADVPCSNSGVLRRHPEKKIFFKRKDLYNLVMLQREILVSLRHILSRGGSLIYITCSLFSQENEEQLFWLSGKFPDIELISWGYIDPRLFNSDGFFVGVLKRK